MKLILEGSRSLPLRPAPSRDAQDCTPKDTPQFLPHPLRSLLRIGTWLEMSVLSSRSPSRFPAIQSDDLFAGCRWVQQRGQQHLLLAAFHPMRMRRTLQCKGSVGPSSCGRTYRKLHELIGVGGSRDHSARCIRARTNQKMAIGATLVQRVQHVRGLKPAVHNRQRSVADLTPKLPRIGVLAVLARSKGDRSEHV